MEINLWELWSTMGLPVKLVVLVLTVQAMGCVYWLSGRIANYEAGVMNAGAELIDPLLAAWRGARALQPEAQRYTATAAASSAATPR